MLNPDDVTMLDMREQSSPALRRTTRYGTEHRSMLTKKDRLIKNLKHLKSAKPNTELERQAIELRIGNIEDTLNNIRKERTIGVPGKGRHRKRLEAWEGAVPKGGASLRNIYDTIGWNDVHKALR